MPVALPGAGKTTWTRTLFPSHKWISSDAIRQELMGDTYDGTRNEEVWTTWNAGIREALERGNSVIADATNLPRRHRFDCQDLARHAGAEIHAIVFRNVGQSVVRNAARKGTQQGNQAVPHAAMINFVRLYEQMLVDIETETYDSVTYIERT